MGNTRALTDTRFLAKTRDLLTGAEISHTLILRYWLNR